MNKLIVIPARGGSKGIPKKNITPVCGKPLICYTLDLVEAAHLEDTDVAVSSDDSEILNVASTYNGIHLIRRPEEFARDNSCTEDTLIHALDFMQREVGSKYASVVTLQPTSPLRCKRTLMDFIGEFEEKYPYYDAYLSLTEDKTDYWRRRDNGSFERLFPEAPRRRQEREALYAENSAYYITDVNALKATKSVLGTHPGGFIISPIEGVDINEYSDVVFAEAILKDRNI